MARELKILLVEDNDSLREVLGHCIKMILEKMGFSYDFVAFDDSRKVLDLLSEQGQHFDLIFSDLHCNPADQSEDSGLLIVQKAKETIPDCVCFVITADDLERSLISKGESCGVNRFFHKPFNLEDIEEGFKGSLVA